ncbi:Siderophore biosynthesis non-ribosomal peptide synthetase module [Actinokineospora spheciospongiae]|uniref:Phenyloxazoline synthase MbtB n=1 Tax=Actinokineospora spheciospongiae TaxID=909613 RepID=W7J019_9PSEU|nr:non-ribosomal peptide synthetase [Actinokineospora spheciospongiae]EWC62191.1 Siderophore biosynthesis non-ribosomal peptide synthetase module [Actinokineospora spheciospongiae]
MIPPHPAATPDPANRHSPFPLNDQQQAYLLGRTGVFELGNVSTHAYYEYEGHLDPARFTAAWRRAIARHDVLRTVMLPDTNQQQVLADPGEFTPVLRDLRGTDPQPTLTEIRDRLSHEVRPADQWPLYAVEISLLDAPTAQTSPDSAIPDAPSCPQARSTPPTNPVPAGRMASGTAIPSGGWGLGMERAREEFCRVHVSFDALVLDYLSWQLLIADLTRFYADPDLDVPPPGIGFREYVLAEAELAGTDRYRRAADYWRARIPELPPAPRLPTAVDPATVRHPRWSSRLDTLPADDWAAVKLTAAKAGLTPTVLCLAVFTEVLTAWSESARFSVNVPRMNRFPLHPDVNGLLGEFASFSLLAVDNREPAPFVERAKALQKSFWADLSHQEFSGVRVLRELVKAGGGTRGAVMPVVLTSTIGFTAGENPLLGERLPRVFAISQTPQVYLDVQIEETPAGLVYNFDSVDGVFPGGLVGELFAAFGAVLARLVDPAAWSTVDFGLAGPSRVDGPVRDIPEELVQDAFLRRVAEHPDKVAVRCGETALTYAELHEKARRIASWLRVRDVDGPVAIVLDKGWEQVAAAYGVLLAGSPYLPIDAAAPQARTAAITAQAGVSVVLDRAAVAVAFAEDVVDFPASRQTPDDLAYVLFTSGSTGTPKGAMIGHRGMVNALGATVEEFGVGPDDVALAVTALHHDMSTFDLFGVLGAGGTLVVPTADRDAEHWAGLVREHGVTVWNSVPAMAEMLLEVTTPRLRLVFLGGDWVPPRVVARLGEATVVSVGGPTETTLWNIWHRVSAADLACPTIPYGRPIANTAYRVLDERGFDRPVGVAGELHCAGPGVAHGYWGDPERTARSFVEVDGERWYRTGDLGRLRADGVLEFVGRADAQLKVRGMRIEPGEVESVLAAVPGVRSAVVVGVPNESGPGHRALAGYVTGAVDPEAVRAAARSALPEHMVPATVAVLPELPLTGNGKVDRAALTAAVPAAAEHVEPEGALATTIADTWADVLGLDRVSATADFFALGGDSLLATRVLAELREALDTPDLPLMALFGTGTVAGMAEALLAAEAEPGRLRRVAELYQEVMSLSDDEVAAELTP